MRLIKEFNAKLHGVIPMAEKENNIIDLTIKFTKNKIWLKTKETELLFSAPFMTNPIADGSTYTFEKTYNRKDEQIYQVIIAGGPPHTFVLDISLWNKFRANCLHDRFTLKVRLPHRGEASKICPISTQDRRRIYSPSESIRPIS